MDAARIARIVLVSALVALFVFGLAGCQRAAERVMEEATGIKVDDDGDTVTMKTDEGEMTISGSDGGTLPEDWPSDMPVYKDATIESTSAIRSGGNTVFSVSLLTGDAFNDVFDWYQEELVSEGWTIDNEFSMESDGERTANFYSSKGDLESYVWINEVDGQVGIGSQIHSGE